MPPRPRDVPVAVAGVGNGPHALPIDCPHGKAPFVIRGRFDVFVRNAIVAARDLELGARRVERRRFDASVALERVLRFVAGKRSLVGVTICYFGHGIETAES